ncbi:hemagglutinin repeat-containing protein [Fusobacterium vincentii]|uniref:hemagglutinin repeat-containing protein n=1 Tax=Fusobacterium TaxID=848 RepID=UPI00046D330E|nr:hemolysin [Fusobacterium nucleatum]
MKSGDILGGIASSTNTVTGIVSGLASNQGTKLPLSAVNKNNSDGDNDDDQNNQDNTVGKDNLKAAQATNNFYANAGVNLGFNKSSSESKSHNEFGVVTTIKGKDKNSSITYNNVKNITYVGTQAQNTKFIYNNVENITKTAVELNNYSSSNSRSSGISAGVTIGYGDGVQTSVDAVKVSASKSNMNTNGTNFQNGKFLNVDEVHNNTKNMTLSGFNQEGGTVTGNIQNLTIESKQNTSTTIGSTKGGSLSIAPNGMPSGSVNYSQTNGERKYVDNATTFLIGNGSNLKIGKVDNTAAAIGATGNGKISIDEYVGHNLENVDKSKTVGGSVGISTSGINSIGINYNDRKQEGITKNTVIGNVEIGKFSGAEINKDLDSMTEVTKDRKFETNVNIESQTIKYALNPESFKKDLAKAKDEITDIGNVVENTINPKGEDSRNIFANLRAQRWVTSYNNVTGSRMEELSRQFKAGEIDEKQLKEAARDLIKGYGKDIGIDFEVVYLDEETMPKDSKGSTGSSYILDKKNKKVLIPIDVNKIGDINKLFGTLTEEVSHGKDALEGRQDKKVAEDKSNDEEGLESLGRPANDYVKNKLGEDNNSKIKLSTDGIDLTNTDVGEKVGDNTLALVEEGTFVLKTGATAEIGMATVGVSAPALVVGGAIIGAFYYASMPEEQKKQLKREISEIYEDVKKGFGSILDKESSKNLVADVIKFKLKEKGIAADVKIDEDKNGNVTYIVSPLPENMKKPKIPPFPLSEEKIFKLPPIEAPKQETWKERWEKEERDRREQKEKMDERNKPNGVPLQQEKPVTIYTISTNEAKEMYKGVQGKNKVTNIQKNLTQKEMENKKNKANSKILDEQLQNAGIEKPDYNCAAHHIVSDRTMPNATKALNDYGIDINSATNGVYLPTANADSSKVTTEVVHSGPNGKDYKDALETSIPDIVENMENVNASYNEIQAALENELNNTRAKLLTGELKINNAKFKSTTEKGKK